MSEFRTAYGKRERVSVKFPKKGRTKQAFKKDCDINNILAKFQRTGAIDHYTKHSPSYGEIAPATFHQAMNIVCDAQSMFEDLPSSIRSRFENDPAEFLAFVQDPENKAEMVELGLVEAPPVPVELPPDVSGSEATEPSLEGVSEASTAV